MPPPPQVVRRIDVAARSVYWSEGGSYVVIASETSFFMLEYMADAVESFLASGEVTAGLSCPPLACVSLLVLALWVLWRETLPALSGLGPRGRDRNFVREQKELY
jgi:hypothetical protein